MSQSEKLYQLLKDGNPHSTIEILETVYGVGHNGVARISARIMELRKKHEITGWKDEKNPAIYWYQLTAVGADQAASASLVESGNLPVRFGNSGVPASRQLNLLEVPVRVTTPWD